MRGFASSMGRSLAWAQMVCDGRQVPFISQARQIADVLRCSKSERRDLLEAVARIRLMRSERMSAEEVAPLVAAAGGL